MQERYRIVSTKELVVQRMAGRTKGTRNRRTTALATAVKTLAANGLSQTAISDKLCLAPKTVKELMAETRGMLEAESAGVLQDWRTAASVGARKGRHEPARDWLLHAGVIQPVASEKPAGPQIMIGIASLPGLPGWGESGAITVSPVSHNSTQSDKDNG